MEQSVQNLMSKAREVKKNSYSPYSNFRVGCAIRLKDGTEITGVNVENVSFGATNCAERSALFTAISQGYKPKSIAAIAVAGDTADFLPPCSVCRQVMVELCDPNTPVYLTREDGEIFETTVHALVPFSFESMDL